jgi:hypothetical protein
METSASASADFGGAGEDTPSASPTQCSFYDGKPDGDPVKCQACREPDVVQKLQIDQLKGKQP